MQTLITVGPEGAIPIHAVGADTAEGALAQLDERERRFAASLGFLGQGPPSPVSSPSAAGRAKASPFASLTFFDRGSLRGLRSPSTAMSHRGRNLHSRARKGLEFSDRLKFSKIIAMIFF